MSAPTTIYDSVYSMVMCRFEQFHIMVHILLPFLNFTFVITEIF